MNNLSRTLRVLLFACPGAGLVPVAATTDWNWAGLQEHPVRTAVGVSSLALGLILLVYRLLRNRIRAARRARSYGSEPAGTEAANGSGYRRRHGKRCVIHQPVSASPARYRRRTFRLSKAPEPNAAEPYHGGSRTTAKEPQRDRMTGLPLGPKLSDKQRYGTRRYGGKLYSSGPKPFRAEEPPGYPFPEENVLEQAAPDVEQPALQGEQPRPTPCT